MFVYLYLFSNTLWLSTFWATLIARFAMFLINIRALFLIAPHMLKSFNESGCVTIYYNDSHDRPKKISFITTVDGFKRIEKYQQLCVKVHSL